MKNIIFAIIAIFLIYQCSSERKKDTYKSKTYSEKRIEAQTTNTYHENSHFMYNHRTGTSGNYTYNYDVEDIEGLGITGNCDMVGKYGDCSLVNKDGDEFYGEAEWIRNGIMEVTDENGDTYEMEAK